jgi:hypothetical protein
LPPEIKAGQPNPTNIINFKNYTFMEKKNNKTTTKLTPHFTLEEMTHTDVKLGYVDNLRQTQPDEQVMENLTRVCQWLEMLRQRWNEKYGSLTPSPSPEREGRSYKEAPVIVNSAYRCKELNRLVGGCTTSNHLTGCAADLRVIGKEQLLRYVVLLLDISDEMHQDFDELLMERNARGYWLHFAVRPKNNRRKISLLNVI